MADPIKKDSISKLRQKAENLLKRKPSKISVHDSDLELVKLAHELEVYLIKQLRAYAGNASYDRQELGISSLFNDHLELFRTILGKNSILETDFTDKTLLVKGDKSELLKVIINILYNASEAIGEKDGIVKISTGLKYFNKKNMVNNRLSQNLEPGYYVFIEVSDNELLVLDITSDMVEMLGFEAIKAGNGLEVLEIYRENRGKIDGFILDIVMPEMGGVAAAQEIRKMDKDIKIIFASGYDQGDKSLHLDDVKYDAFLQKPYDSLSLKEILVTVFKDLIIDENETKSGADYGA